MSSHMTHALFPVVFGVFKAGLQLDRLQACWSFTCAFPLGLADSDLAVAGCWCCAKLSSQHACEVLEQTLSEST